LKGNRQLPKNNKSAYRRWNSWRGREFEIFKTATVWNVLDKV